MPKIKTTKTILEFLAVKISYQVRELYISSAMINLAVAMVAIFEPIYLYKSGFSLEWVLYFYLAVYGLYILILPLGAKFARRFGYEKAIILSTPFLALYYIFLYLIYYDIAFVYPAVLSFVLQKAFYWPGYHADFARFGRSSERGREVSNITAIITIVSIAGPFLGGALIAIFGFKVLFIVSTAIILTSNISLLLTPEKFTSKPFSYFRTYRRLFYKENRRNFFGFLGFGEEFLSMIIWPIFIFTLVSNFFSIGSIVALSTLATTIILLFVGRMVDGDSNERHSILKIGAVFKSASWFVALLAKGVMGVFLVDSLARITKNVVIVPMMAMTYDHANETSVMKTIVFFEMSLVVGKILSMLISLIVLRFVPGSFPALFVLGGSMSILYSLIKYEAIKLSESRKY